MSSSFAIVVYCPRCDYFTKTAVQIDAVGTHACHGCNGLMEVYIAQGETEVAIWHNTPSFSIAPTPEENDENS